MAMLHNTGARGSAAAAQKALPAYGRDLLEVRRQGLVPRRGFFLAHVIVVLDDWKLARSLFRLVIAADTDPVALDFAGVAGLDTIIVYNSRVTQPDRVKAAIGAVLSGQPRELVAMDVLHSHAPKIIRAAGLGIERAAGTT